MDEAGQFKQIIGMSMDVTAPKVSELQMRAQLEEMSHLSRLAVVGELTASIAHEINQPLGAILANAEAAEILLESPVPTLDSIREILADIRSDDARATEVVRRLRSLLRKRELEIRPLDFNELVRDTLRFVAFDARRRGVDIFAVLAPSLPQVQGDKLHLQQVLLNLILNGMDAMAETPETKRHLSVATKPDAKGGIECSIEDSGRGIPAESLDKLFESFFSTKPNGVGLGLSIARSIVEAHRGRIWAENKPGGGAIFHLVLRATVPGEFE
jgi:signal transduction histidine kinase